MSHIASVQLFVTDLDALEAVADRLGFDLVRGATNYQWYGRFMNDSQLAPGHDPKTFGTCEHKLRLKNAQSGDYEIGLVRRVDGGQGWELLYDNWSTYGARLHAKAGNNLSKLKDELAAEVSTRQLQKQGYRVRRTVTPQGQIQLRASI
jgi:hypothetical protein